MSLTFGQAKSMLAQYAGRAGFCPDSDSPELELFVRKVLQKLLYSGTAGHLRKFCFNAYKGCITLPYELEVPLKVKIDGVVGTVWNKWYEYYNIGELDSGCLPAAEALTEDGNTYPTVYDIPVGGGRLGAIGTANEEDNAHVIFHGEDNTGRRIVTNHKGTQYDGEYVSVRRGELHYTQSTFAKVTEVEKTKTTGYVQAVWVRPDVGTKGFLADYSPLDVAPTYRRFRLTAPDCGPSVKVSILGRIRIKDAYHDNEFIPFDNLYALDLAAQSMQLGYNENVQVAEARDQRLDAVISKENEYKRPESGPMDVFFPLSGGAVRNII